MLTKRDMMLGLAISGLAATPTRAEFIGELIVEPLSDGRSLKLIKPYAYRAPNRELWSVPAGAIVDGASIPRAFWSFIGGPFEGKYRNASVIHDWYCDRRTRPWRSVHRVFYDAMIDSHVNEALAKTMYAAVQWFGPRWSSAVVQNNNLRAVTASVFAAGAQTPAANRAIRSALQNLETTIHSLEGQPTPDGLAVGVAQPGFGGSPPVGATTAAGSLEEADIAAMLSRAPGQATAGQATVGPLTASAFLKTSSDNAAELTVVEEREPTEEQVNWLKMHGPDLTLEQIAALGEP